MKKVIALDEKESRVLTTAKTAEKNNWWITHNLEVEILSLTEPSPKTSIEPEVGNVMEAKNRFYKIIKSKKILVCTICKLKANFKIGYRFYCKKHYKHLTLTLPIRRLLIQPERNSICTCGSGLKFKYCCIVKFEHVPRHFFNSRYMQDPKIVKSLQTVVKS